MRVKTLPAVGALIAVFLLTWPLTTEAQQPGKIAKLGRLAPEGLSLPGHGTYEALYGSLRKLGWVDGQNLILEGRAAGGKPERLPDLARELVRLNVDVIVVGSCGAVLDAVRLATTRIPIVVVTCNDDMVAAGIVASLARPGGNITGLSKLTPELSAKRLALLSEALPTLSSVGVLWNPDYSAFAADWRSLREAARQLKISVHSVEVRRASEFDAAFAALRRERMGAFMMFSDLIGWYHTTEIAEAALRNRLPAIYAFREAVDAGGLMSYGPNIEDLHRRAAGYIDKILRGAHPGDLPIEQPTKFELIVNLKTAKALDVAIPRSLLLRADQIIE